MSLRIGSPSEPWRFSIPGVGRAVIDPDGMVRTDEATSDARRIVRHVTEPVAWLRRGRALLRGTTLEEPETRTAIVVCGSAKQEQAVMLGLLGKAWAVVADHLSPVQVDPVPAVEARASDVVIDVKTAAARGAVGATSVRPGVSGTGVPLPRALGTAPLVGIAIMDPAFAGGRELAPTSAERLAFVRSAMPLANDRVLGSRRAFTVAATLARLPLLVIGTSDTHGRPIPGASDRLARWHQGGLR